MSGISIIVEGKEDTRFLIDFIQFHFNKNIERDSFIEVEGKAEKLFQSKPTIQASTDKGKVNIILFDADDSDYTSTLSKVNKKRQELFLQLDYIFLFPDNKSKGNLESLLRTCIPDQNATILNCIKQYNDCKKTLSINNLRDIDEKEELFIYHGSFLDTGVAHASKRAYLNSIWNLDCEETKPLKDFLSQFFQ